MIIDIPGGQATLRDKINVRQRRLLQTAAFGASSIMAKLPKKSEEGEDVEVSDVVQMEVSQEEAQSLFALEDATILALLESWTLDQPLPQNSEDLMSIDSDVYDVLLQKCGEQRTAVMGTVDTEMSLDPKAPISGSSS